MSGPGVRYWELARVLGNNPGLDVTLAVTPGVVMQSPRDGPPFRLQSCHSEADLRAVATMAEVIVAPGAVISLYPSLRQIQKPLVLDLYIPLLLEELQRPRLQSLAEQTIFFDRMRRGLFTQILVADFIICASEKQRDYWLGVLSAVGRINPYTHTDDPTLRRLIDVVPFGLSSQPPRHTRPVLKGAYPGISADDKVLLWGGGLYDWFDTPTLIQAMAQLADRRPDVKLFFMGVSHPNPQEAQRDGTRETLALAKESGLTDRTVFFNDWVPYEERANYLLEADVGLSLHRDHLETRFSFRTRFLDYLWAGLPIVATRGDVLSEEIEAQHLGLVIDPGDVDALVEAILSLVDVPNLRQVHRPRFERIAATYRWEVIARPLIDFCTAPRLALDKDYVRKMSRLDVGPTPWWQLPGKAWHALQVGGLRGLARQVDAYRRWVLNRQGRR